MYERRRQPLLSRRAFVERMLWSATFAMLVLGVSLGIGIVGYRWLGELAWIDALLNASMILTGMGPVNPMQTVPAKLFASAYALFSGIAFLTTSGLLFAPLVHRLLHTFHVDAESEDKKD